MTDQPEQPNRVSAPSDKSETRAKKAQTREEKRERKAAAKAERASDLANLSEETLGVLMGFRVFKDGTVQADSASTRSTNTVGSLQNKLSGVLSVANGSARSSILDVAFIDKRVRKPFARARAALPSTGLVGNGRDHFGSVSLTITTYDWTEKLVASSEQNVAALEALNKMLLQAQNTAPPTGATQSQPAPPMPSPPQTPPPQVDVPAALRELKALHEEGLLTDDEFETRRQALLVHLPVTPQTRPPEA